MARWLKPLLLNRTTITFAVIAIAAALWNAYVAFKDDGILTGRVEYADGSAAAGLQVDLYKQELIGLERLAATHTDADGRFRFEHHGQHKPILEAVPPDGTKGPVRVVRLMFRNENRELAQPMVIVR